jgi:autotransporter-associated beta strand protein
MKIMKNMVRLMVGMAFVCLTLNVYAVAYWNCSSPTGPASGTWNETNATWTGNTALFTYSPLGGPTANDPIGWTSGDPYDGNVVLQGNYASAFSLGTEPNGMPSAYTITVDNSLGQVGCADLLVYSGPMTLTGGKLDFINIVNNSPSSTSDAGLVFTIHNGQTAYFNLNMTNTVGAYSTASIGRNVFANKQSTGILYFGAANSFNGDIAVKSGILGITVDQAIPSSSSLILLNGSDIGGASDQVSNTPPVFNTGGHNQTFNQLFLAGLNSLIPRTIDFNNGHGSLTFAGNSSSLVWTSTPSVVWGDSNPGAITLVITNFQLGTTQLRFGTTSSGLTAGQLAQIKFADYTNAPGQISSSGYVTPIVPQPIINSIKQTYTINWNAISGTHYQVQFSSSVSGPWTNLAVVIASNTTGTYTDVTTGASQRFYQVIQE